MSWGDGIWRLSGKWCIRVGAGEGRWTHADLLEDICYIGAMSNKLTIDDLKRTGADRAAPEKLRALYRQAFRDYGLRALWSSRPVTEPTIADVLAITESLRVEGGLPGRRLAEQIVAGCRAAL